MAKNFVYSDYSTLLEVSNFKPSATAQKREKPMATDYSSHKKILDEDRIYFPEDAEMRIFGSIELLAQWRHRNRGPAFIRIGRRIGYHGTDLNSYLNTQRTDPNGEAA